MTGALIKFARTSIAIAGILIIAACGSNVSRPNQPTIPASGGEGKIALLLPYGDENRKDLIALASSLENSARLALSDKAADGFELQVYQTLGTVEGAETAAQAALNDGAIVIVGPVFSDASIRVAKIAAPQRVPVFSFSNDASIVGGNLFILGHTFENAANRIIKFAAISGHQQFLTVYAKNPQGQAGKSAIENAARQSVNGLLNSVSYEFSQKGVVDSIPKIVQTVEQSETDIIIFTADTAGGLSLLGQMLPEAGVDTERVKFAGLTRWDIPKNNLQIEGLQGGWFVLPDPNLFSSFSFRYQYQYGDPPHPLASLAYDGIIVAMEIIDRSGRANLRILSNPRGFSGVTGPFRFQSNGQIERSLAIAEVQNSNAQIISAAPRNFSEAIL